MMMILRLTGKPVKTLKGKSNMNKSVSTSNKSSQTTLDILESCDIFG